MVYYDYYFTHIVCRYNYERILIMKNLEDVLRFDNTLPYLFIGSGFSRRYLDTPDWNGLLKYFCNIVYPDNSLAYKELQERAKQKLRSENKDCKSANNIYSYTADLLEDVFNLHWYKDDFYKDSREKNAHLIDDDLTPFKLELANYFNEMLRKPHLLSDELEKLHLITSNSISGIITTNYDCLIEEYFDFKKYVSQEELLFSNTQELCELYKIHGCSSSPESIIINSKDYEMVARKRKYLAAKLLTIFVEHPIIFIGYSISDEDITSILTDIVDCLSDEQLSTFRSRLIFIDRLSEDSTEEYTVEDMSVIIDGKSIPMIKICAKDYGIIYDVLSQNKSKYPVKILRSLKQNIYELVTTNDPADKLKIMLPFDKMDNFQNIEYVIGVGISQIAEQAYASFSIEDIFTDVVLDNKGFNCDLIVEKTLLPHLARTSGSLPMYKYLSQYSKEKLPDGLEHYIEKHKSINALLNGTIIHGRSTLYGKTVAEICEKYEYPKTLYYIPRLPIANTDAKELHSYLIEVLKNNPENIKSGMQNSSDIRRLIKILDWLLYHDEFAKKRASMHTV